MTQSAASSLRTGQQEPTYSSSLTFNRTYGPECAEFCAAAGLNLLPWQRRILDRWLAVGDDGLWLAPTAGAMIPRQQGKSEAVLLARVAFGLIVLRENVAFTSHRSDAEREFFEALRRFLLQPAFERYVTEDDFRAAVGREKLELATGNNIEFYARSNKSGRSKHIDLIVFDEAQYLTSSQQSSMVPTALTRPNMQIIETGTPPEKIDEGDEFSDTRKRGHANEPLMCWDEWGLSKMPDDVSDREVWYRVMPSLGYTIRERNVEILLAKMKPEDFAREVLGLWIERSRAASAALDVKRWHECEVPVAPEVAKDERMACGIKFSADGSTYSVSMATRSKRDGYTLVECVDRTGTARGVTGLARWLYDRRGSIATVCIDGHSWTPTLIQRLEELGYPARGLHTMKSRELCDACAMLSAAVSEGSLSHIRQPLLDESVESSTVRTIGRDGWAFGGEDPTPIESVALALWGVMTTKRNPRRKQRISV